MLKQNYVLKFSKKAMYELRTHYFQVTEGVDEDKAWGMAYDYHIKHDLWH